MTRHSYNRPKLSIFAILVVVLLTPGSARSADYFWQNISGGNWNVAGNWAAGPTPPPGAADNAIIDIGGSYTITLNDARSITNLTLTNFSAGATLNHTAGTLTVSGTIALNHLQGIYSLNGGTISGGSIVSGGGALRLQNNANNRLNNVSLGLNTLDFSSA